MDNIKFIAVKVMDDEDGSTLGRPVWTVEWIDPKIKNKKIICEEWRLCLSFPFVVKQFGFTECLFLTMCAYSMFVLSKCNSLSLLHLVMYLRLVGF